MAFDCKKNNVGKAVLVASLMFLGIGSVRTFKAYDKSSDDFGVMIFTKVTEKQLNIDATFGGVERRDGKLYSTYNRLESHGKRACPT